MRIVGVHGVGNYAYIDRHHSVDIAAQAISADWTAALSNGTGDMPVSVAFYAHLLRRGTAQGLDDVTLLEPAEQEMLVSWIDALAGVSSRPQGRATAQIRQAAEWLTQRYGPTTRRLGITFIREVNAYLHMPDQPFRINTRDCVAETIRANQANVVIAHSLGSVIAYEALWAYPDLKIDLLVTLGSPLGMNEVIFQKLEPGPMNGRCGRPPGARRWVNLADIGDLVAIPADLRSRFDGVEQAAPLRIARFDFHTVKNYLASDQVRTLLRSGGS